MKKLITKKFCREILAPLGLFLFIASLALMVAVPVNAQTAADAIKNIGDATKLPSYDTAGHANASFESGASNITSAILFAVDLIKYVIGTVAVFFILITAIRLITARIYVEEVAKKQKEHLLFSSIGLIIIIVADQFVKQVFFGEQGEIFRSQVELQAAAERGTEHIVGIYNFIEYFAAALAILMIVIAGFRLVISQGNEDTQGKVKKQLMYAIIGLIVLGVSEFVVKDLIFPKSGKVLPDIEKTKLFIVKMTNFVSGFIATLSVIMYIYGGYLYVIDTGKEENTGKAKKVFTGATIGLLLALGAFALVTTLVKLEPSTTLPGAGQNLP